MATPPIYTGTQENMPSSTHASGNFQGYTPKPGQLFIGANKFLAPTTSETGISFVRNGSGNYSVHVPAALTVVLVADLGQILSQVQLPALPPIGNTAGATVYNQSVTGVQTMGISIASINVLYKVTTANLTSASVTVTKTVWPTDNSAAVPVVTNVLAASNLTLVQRANIYNTAAVVTDTAMFAAANTEILAEINVVTPASSIFDLYGIVVNLNYNY